MTLGEHHCETESYHEMKMLAQLEERLPRDLARAVLMVPAKIPEYVAYSLTSVEDPHSDYALQMEKVCRAKHAEFFDAVAKLPREKRDRFLKYVFDLDGCNASVFLKPSRWVSCTPISDAPTPPALPARTPPRWPSTKN
jgi:hypothetical protein